MRVLIGGPLRLLVAIAGCLVFLGSVGAVSATAGVAAPEFTRTVDVEPVSGAVFVTVSGKSARLSAAMQLPLGATVDARLGTVRVISGTPRPGVTHTARFSEGEFQLNQPRGEGGTLEVHLVGGNFGACKRGAVPARYQTNQVVRQLSTVSGYGVHTNGRYGGGRGARGGLGHRAVDAATPTTAWDTLDRCSGTTVIVRSGHVKTDGGKVPLSFILGPDESAQYNCSAAHPSYCAANRSFDPEVTFDGKTVHNPFYVLTLVTRSPATSYDLAINGARGGDTSLVYPLSNPGPAGYRRSDVTCVPDQGKGDYQITWRIGTLAVPALTYVAQNASPDVVPCTSVPPGLGIPSGLSANALQPNIDIHYTSDPNDKTDAVSDAIAASVAQLAQSAFTFDTGVLGMPGTVGGSMIDIYVEGKSSRTSAAIAIPPVPAPGEPARAAIVLVPTDAGNPITIASDVFGVLEDAIGRIDGVGLERPALSGSVGYWAAADWAATAGVQITPIVPLLGQPLDCDLSCPFDAVYDGWRFYQHLNERFPGIVPQLLGADAALVLGLPGPQMDNALESVLTSRGSSLAGELAQYELEDLGDSWTAPWVGQGGPSSGGFQSSILNPMGQSISRMSSVAHLASRYLVLTVNAAYPCVNDTLTLDTTVPAGTGLPAADLAPGATVESGGQFQTVLASPVSSTEQEVTVTLPSCSKAVIRVPFVNGTTGQTPLAFTATGNLERGS